MSIRRRAESIPGVSQIAGMVDVLGGFTRGFRFARNYAAIDPACLGEVARQSERNPLEEYFDSHFAKYRDSAVHLVEVGVSGGGSLEMWRHYFGDDCHIYGVDIDEACKIHERDGVSIFVGDQADPGFWRQFLDSVPVIDIVIDDGGHQMHQQIATLEALLPSLTPGGVYLCEDVHGTVNGFQGYVNGMIYNLNKWAPPTSSFQQSVHSVHLYPFVTVIERNGPDRVTFAAPQHGSDWLH
jgi:23S rRNA U2552 (ribose-2'-O)-methylase RlmE/FtsJ